MSAGPTRDAAEFTAFGLVADLRAALGDDGARMQDELIVWARALAADAARYHWLRSARWWPDDVEAAHCLGDTDALDAAIDAAIWRKERDLQRRSR